MLKHLNVLNKHPLFLGFITLALNIGSRYVRTPLTKKQEEILTSEFARQFLVFAVFFQSTKDVVTALILTASLHILTRHLFHEESVFCVIPHSFRELNDELDTNHDSKVSKKEVLDAIKILKKNKAKTGKLQK